MKTSMRPMNTIPGISIRTNESAGRKLAGNPAAAPCHEFLNETHDRRFIHTLRLSHWISAAIDTRNGRYDAFHADAAGVTVLVDGYLSAPLRESGMPQAEWITKKYLELGISFLAGLRGSYTSLIYDARNDTAIIFNDRLGSRPLYYYKSPLDLYAIGPEILGFATIEHAVTEIDDAAVIEFLIAGNQYSERTIFKSIKKLPQGSLITITRNNFSVSQYWRLAYPADGRSIQDESAIEECHSLLLQAVDRTSRACGNPVLFLSGGMDSRLMLGLLLEKGIKIPVASYGSGEGDDFNIAKQIASENELHLTEFRISFDSVIPQLAEAVLAVDGRSEVLDAPSLYLFSRSLADTYDSHIVGDVTLLHKFGNISALDEVELYALDRVARLKSWIRPEHLGDLTAEITSSRSRLAQNCGSSVFTNQFEYLYYTSRLANMQNGFTAGKLRDLEQARPFLDEDLVDFLIRLPVRLRDNKYLYRQLLERKFPDLANIPYAKKDSLPTPEKVRQQLLSDKVFSEYVKSMLIDNLDSRLDYLFDTARLSDFLRPYLSGKQLPNVSSSWLMKVPGLWRYLPTLENRVHPAKLIMRLLHVQLYLSSFKLGNLSIVNAAD